MDYWLTTYAHARGMDVARDIACGLDDLLGADAARDVDRAHSVRLMSSASK